jgi:RHH-type rel operon transcriptional repressor/antitoxin RelB
MVNAAVLLNNMEKQTVSFRLDSDKVEALDGLAKALDRDRTYLLNEAVAAYLDVQQWQFEHIQASIKQADAGQFVIHAEVKRMAGKWRRRR